MRQYLAEGLKGAVPFVVDRTKPPVIESRPNGQAFRRIPGRFSVCDCINGNNRRYRKQVWEKNLQPGSPLQEAIAKNAAFGLLEHPKDGLVTLESPISHQVVKAEMVESKDANGKPVYEVFGEIALYDTEEGRKLQALIEGGYNPLVSSRGYGSLEKASDGVDEVMDDYVCESWDVVIKPSFATAELVPSRAPLSSTEPKMAAPAVPNPTAESTTEKCCVCGIPCSEVRHFKSGKPCCSQACSISKDKDLKESLPSTGSSGVPARTSNDNSRTDRMEITEIKTQITALESLEPTKLTRFAESMAQVEGLHQQVAEWAAADPKRSWEAQKLHRKLDTIAETYTATAKAPVKEARRLSEQNVKLMKVINAVAKTALTYKKKLGESIKVKGSSGKLNEELVRRGQGWQKLAESRKQKYLALERDFDTSCEALDIMARRYHEDTSELSRRLLVLEFKEKTQTPEMQKALKEATRLKHFAAIREQLEGKGNKNSVQEEDGVGKPAEGETPGKEALKAGKVKGAGSPEAGKVAEEPGKVKTESGPKGKSAETITESQIVRGSRDIRDLSESVNLVQRLSGAAK